MTRTPLMETAVNECGFGFDPQGNQFEGAKVECETGSLNEEHCLEFAKVINPIGAFDEQKSVDSNAYGEVFLMFHSLDK